MKRINGNERIKGGGKLRRELTQQVHAANHYMAMISSKVVHGPQFAT